LGVCSIVADSDFCFGNNRSGCVVDGSADGAFSCRLGNEQRASKAESQREGEGPPQGFRKIWLQHSCFSWKLIKLGDFYAGRLRLIIIAVVQIATSKDGLGVIAGDGIRELPMA